MKYVMFYCVDDSVKLEPAQLDEFDRELGAWCAELDRRRVRLRGQQLAPASAATTVRVREGEVMVADNPAARFDTIELRPVVEE